jgi:hypothetical protein
MIYIYISWLKNERRLRRKEEKDDCEKYWNTSHLYRNKTQQNTLKTVEQYRYGEGEGRVIEGV